MMERGGGELLVSVLRYFFIIIQRNTYCKPAFAAMHGRTALSDSVIRSAKIG